LNWIFGEVEPYRTHIIVRKLKKSVHVAARLVTEKDIVSGIGESS